MGPLTPFETTGQWTTLEEETTLLHTIASNTDVTVSVAGKTVLGRDIHRVELGAGSEHTMLIVCLQHGNEPASREGALQQIRDLAYSTDPEVMDFLAHHRIVWVPTVNADRLDSNRMNAAGQDLNRDWFLLTQPETQAVVRLIHDAKPSLIIDAHEFFSGGTDWLGRGGGVPDTHPAVSTLGLEAQDMVIATMQAQGYTAGKFMTNPARGSLGGLAGSLHTVGLLSESDATTSTPQARVAAQLSLMELMREWFGDNAAACLVAQKESLAWSLANDGPVELMVDHVFIGDLPPEVVDLDGYRLHEDLPTKYREAFGITADPAGFVTMRQSARRIIPHIMDPTAVGRQVYATRVLHGDPRPDPPGPAFRVMVDGEVSDVADIVVQLDGERFGVIGVDASRESS